MKIKQKDNVIIIAGKDKGKTGKITRVFPKKDMVLIAGFNLKKKHQRARKSGEKGQIIDRPMPIHVSNVMIVDPDTARPVKTGRKLVGERFVRINRKSGKEI
ncbi:MAG: 50S ribosomal protein L24 [Patescibacteria group bacterium]